MTSSSSLPSIVFFGNERLATGVTTQAPTLKALVEAGYPIEAIVVNHDRAISRKLRMLEVEELARQHNIPVLKPSSKAELEDAVQNLASPIAVLAAYGRIIPASVINHFEHGILNVHPSALPEYRGSTPLESVILDGSSSTAVSLMQLDVKMDAGAVYAQNDILLNGRTSKKELADAAGLLGAQMIIETLPQILDGSLIPQPQDESLATFTKQISKQDGRINWSKSAQQIEREVRAYAGWPGSSCEINGKLVVITQAQILKETGAPGNFFIHDKQLAVYCGQDALLITHLKPAGKNDMPSRDFLAGNPLN